MSLVTAIFVSSGINVWGLIRYLGGRERQRGSELQKKDRKYWVCVFYHHTLAISIHCPIFLGTPLLLLVNTREKGWKNPNCWLRSPRQTQPSNIWTWRANRPSSSDFMAAFNLSLNCNSLGENVCLVLSADLTLAQEPIRPRKEKLLDKHWQDCTKRKLPKAPNTSAHYHYYYYYFDIIFWGLQIILCSTLGFFISWNAT